MQLLAVSLVVLAVLAVVLPAFTRANPAKLARMIRVGCGVILGGLALLMLARGQFHLAILILGIGVPLLWGKGGQWLRGKPKTTGQTSQVETPVLRMRLDHDSGTMEGDVLRGRFAGRALHGLALADLQVLLLECRHGDPQSLALMEAYLDHRHPEWRETAGTAGGAGSQTASAGSPMTPAEARDILGVGADASADEIRHAWRELMKRNHPDQGGSGYLAAKINAAKELLLNKSA